MSVQTGTMSFDSRNISRSEIEFLLHDLEERGPDYSGIYIAGPVGMGFRGALIAPEDKNDQPIFGGSGVVLTFDGRLDCRSEVVSRLCVPGAAAMSDAALVLLAYEQAGARCFDQLIGEYAFVLWDERRRSLFMVRSLCGTRPLLYVRANNQLLWSSEMDDLVLKSGIDLVVNEVFVARYMYFHPDLDEVPFKSLAAVPPGTYIEIGPRGKVSAPVALWHPEKIETLRLGSDAEYEEAWRQQLETAIADRLRTNRAVFSELSGGLDSTTMVFMADRILTKSGRNPATLTTVSYTYETSEDSDESFFISIAENARGYVGIHVPEETQNITLGLNDITFTGFPATRHIFKGAHKLIGHAMKHCGARVLLNGFGGDELFWSDATSTPELADLLRQRQFADLISTSRRWSQLSGIPLWRFLLMNAILPVARSSRLFGWIRETETPLDSLLTTRAKRDLRDPDRRLGLRIEAAVNLPSRRSRAFSVRSAIATLSSGVFRNMDGIYYSHPYSHQQLIDFMLALPMDQVVRPGESRSVMRRATRGILPDKIRVRRSKSGPDEAFCRAVAREQELLADTAGLLVCSDGYVDPNKLREVIREAALGRTEQVGCLLSVLSVERWLRSLRLVESRRSELKRSHAQAIPVLA